MRGIIHGKYQLATGLHPSGLKNTAKRRKGNPVGIVRAQFRKIINDGNLAPVTFAQPPMRLKWLERSNQTQAIRSQMLLFMVCLTWPKADYQLCLSAQCHLLTRLRAEI